jgi:outer membrane receptor for ferrienterochelin and colicin
VDSTSTLVLLDGRRVSSHEAFRCGGNGGAHALTCCETAQNLMLGIAVQ